MVIFLAAVAGAAAAAAGLLGIVQPFASAGAGTGQSEGQTGDAGARLDQIRSEVAPGSIVKTHEDGSISVLGGGFEGLGPEAQAASQRMNELAEAGPNTIRCSEEAGPVICTPVPDREVIPALKSGKSNLYGRTVYGHITAASLGHPLFENGELVCGDLADDGSMACTSVDDVKPKIRAGESEFVTYKPYNVTFDGGGNPVGRIGEATIPLSLASQ